MGAFFVSLWRVVGLVVGVVACGACCCEEMSCVCVCVCCLLRGLMHAAPSVWLYAKPPAVDDYQIELGDGLLSAFGVGVFDNGELSPGVQLYFSSENGRQSSLYAAGGARTFRQQH